MRIIGSLVMVLLAVAAARPVPPQHVWQADVSVRSLELTMAGRGGPITARIVVAAAMDTARAVRLEVMLPVGVGLVRMPALCQPSPGPVRSLSARATCKLGDIAAGHARELAITTTGAAALRGKLRFAVFALSDTPDPVPANNYADRVVP